jgi:hypothetical protein
VEWLLPALSGQWADEDLWQQYPLNQPIAGRARADPLFRLNEGRPMSGPAGYELELRTDCGPWVLKSNYPTAAGAGL